ncbi:SDR family NAD(P)-dependent oxidoreductase [Cryobacterium lactosi]|uniref:SDR family NAD(P)-dependent oxidoreductase n=1 Tax=Cryobacterium lactosi TaxID=1259202 RepID=A0A4R9BWJ9_9MICO|nr:SDR family NAD(P)-dependent oxidoreductase [Cryobacterium lactosi]TFD92089.1 SDR family NAD(P)-dependent oxidoreductase [Cryobacterium lactosi]
MRSKKRIVITGASDGIGAAAARRFRENGHDVVVVGRSPNKTRAVAEAIDAPYFLADYSRLDDVRSLAASLAEAYGRIDVLANNAGGVFGAKTTTIDGFETTLQVNYLAPYLLTNLLLDTLIRSEATVIQTSSVAARLFGNVDLSDLNNDRRYTPHKAYGDAKLLNILFTRELHNRFQRVGVSAAAFHPGFIRTGFAAESSSIIMRLVYRNPLVKGFLGTSERGADQLAWLAEALPHDEWVPGNYFEAHAVARRINPQGADDDMARSLWTASAEMLGLGTGVRHLG